MYTLRDILYASSIAVVGASGKPSKMGHKLLNNLIEGGFQGKIYPINPKEPELMGLPCYKSLSDVEGSIDLIVVCVPAAAVAGTLREAGKKGVKGAIIISGGFREIGNDDMEAELLSIAREYSIIQQTRCVPHGLL